MAKRPMSDLRRLRVERKAGPMTLAEASKRTGFSRGYICDVENGREPAGEPLVAALARLHRKTTRRIRDLCARAWAAGHRSEVAS